MSASIGLPRALFMVCPCCACWCMQCVCRHRSPSCTGHGLSMLCSQVNAVCLQAAVSLVHRSWFVHVVLAGECSASAGIHMGFGTMLARATPITIASFTWAGPCALHAVQSSGCLLASGVLSVSALQLVLVGPWRGSGGVRFAACACWPFVALSRSTGGVPSSHVSFVTASHEI